MRRKRIVVHQLSCDGGREFLVQSARACAGYALGTAAFVAGVERFSLINAFAQGSDYRALVCIFLAGGNDGNNVVIPTTATESGVARAPRTSNRMSTLFRSSRRRALRPRRPCRAQS